MGTTQYYFKGSAFAHPTSAILSAPRVSSLMSNPAVGLDMVKPGFFTAPKRSLYEFLSLSLFVGVSFVIYVYNGV